MQQESSQIINDTSKVLDVVKQYENAGVSACSILTDELFFGGNKQDVISVRHEITVPILRKDFMIDEYQFIEAKAIGADVVLLIASILTPKQVKDFTALARSLQLEVLLELHDETELNHVCNDVHMVGINNRNLKTFEVDIEQSIRMAEKLGNDFLKVAESGISSVETLKHFKNNGFQGFLIGENFLALVHFTGLLCPGNKTLRIQLLERRGRASISLDENKSIDVKNRIKNLVCM